MTNATNEAKTTALEVGKTYTTSWIWAGQYPRTATFTVEGFAKNGSAKGVYVDADGKRYARTYVKPEKFSEWTAK